MADSEELIELLFFDTFSHEIHEDLNLDLVQFPQPVYITEVRIIPLGARVQADFPGGVRLGATNPSKFQIELFVNDLAKPGASTFECLGNFEYNQNDCINLQCATSSDRSKSIRQIPTDGLVLRGWYTTITLAVYGSVAKDGIAEQQISSPPPPPILVEPITGVLTTNIVPIAIGANVADVKIEQSLELDWHHSERDGKDLTTVSFAKAGGASFYSDELNTSQLQQPTTPQTPNQKDSARQYTENWVAAAGASTSVTGNSSIRAKSPDIESWDADDDLNKTTTSISSPRSNRRSRSPPDTRRSKRDWSKSPEYRRRRPYDRGVLDKKLLKTREYESARRSPPLPLTRMPRTPSPEILHSPSTSRRPRTPERRLSDDFSKHKFYSKSVQSPQSVTEETDVINASDPVSSLAPTEPDDEAMSQGEAFEPILSDDEIGDDSFEQYEIDYDDSDDTAIASALKQFNPFTEELRHYCTSDDKMSANAKELIELATKCLHRSKLKENQCMEKSFIESQSTEMKENWVHAAEQLIQIINLIYNLAGATQARSQQALNALITLNRTQLVDWMKIGLNFDCANSQQQPGYKIRHIKCGIRLIELTAVDEPFIECLIFKEKFNVFDYLFRLYDQKFMALSIKLMICKAIYTCLDTRTGINYFTDPVEMADVKPFVTEENGYQKLIKLLQQNPLTRIKFALKSIFKKVNLYESLQVIRDTANRRLVSFDIKSEELLSEVDIAADQQLLKNCLTEVWRAFTWNAQSYSQPKRFLPISTKFEKVKDANATKCAANSFLRYFRIHSLLESLLLLISTNNSSLVNEEIFDVTLLVLESLCRTGNGLEYLSANAEVTNVLVKCLLQAQQVIQKRTQDDDVNAEDELNIEPSNVDAVPVDIDEDTRMYQLGMEIAYKTKSIYCLDAIADITLNTENREELLIEHFHTLYSLAVADNHICRKHVIETITMNSNIIVILKQIENEKKAINAATIKQKTLGLTTSGENGSADPDELKYKKGPILNYAIDLIDLTVRYSNTNIEYLRQHGQILLNLVKSYDQFDAPISQVLQDLAVYLKPLEIQNVFAYDNIGPLCEIIKRNLEFITTFPGDLITALRIIRFSAIPDTRTFDNGTDFVDTFGDAAAATSLTQNKYQLKTEQHQIELKYKFVILQFYSADGISTCCSIMDKLTAYFAQPAVHAAALLTHQGSLATQILLPTIEILRKMLTYVIDCRNTEFKDLTAIEPILKTYTLINYVPMQSTAAEDAQQIQNEIVKTLMAYTQPTPVSGVDTESVHKSLWTQMIGELCKYIMSGPYTFMAGLTLLMHLLPIPLPILTRRTLTSAEQARLVTERQLWSAHLHPQSILISEMIQSLCISSYSPLLDLLARVIGQLADLAPNMSLLATKAIIDLLLEDGSSSIQSIEQKNVTTVTPSGDATGTSNTIATATTTSNTNNTISSTQSQTTLILTYVNPQTKRVLSFLANILCYPSIKVAFLSIIAGKVYELLIKILSVKSTAIPSTLHSVLAQQQEYVLTIFHTIFNADISLVNHLDATSFSDKSAAQSELVLGCSLPPKECLLGIISAVLDSFLIIDDAIHTFGCQFAALKTMMILSAYDYTTYQLRILLDKRKETLLTKLRSLSRPAENDQNTHEIILTFLLFLQSLIRADLVKNERLYACSEIDLVKILQYKRSSDELQTDINAITAHPLLVLDGHLNKLLTKSELTYDAKIQIEEEIINLKSVLKSLDDGLAAIAANSNKELLQNSPAGEPVFPQGEGIVTQYTMRPIFTVISSDNNLLTDQLTTNYWCSKPSPLRFDDGNETLTTDTISCDLIEMIKTCLPLETNLTSDCKRLLHLSASPQSNRERTTSAPCFRTRRVEVEPTTGRPEKKIYVSRGRGFPRSAPTRGDLFRSRPPNTSRPPSLHVDDFLALETCGAQPTGPTGYNKLAREIISIRGTRGGRGRGRIGLTGSGTPYRHSSIRRTNSPSTWANHLNAGGNSGSGAQHDGSPSSGPQHYRTATAEPVHSSHFQSDYSSQHFNSPSIRGRRGMRPPRSFNKFN